jgi:hypothetical protein
MRPKVIARNTHVGQQGVNLIERIVLGMGYLWHLTVVFDAGIDGEIEIRDEVTGEVYSARIAVQSKAVHSGFDNETDSGFDFYCLDFGHL